MQASRFAPSRFARVVDPQRHSRLAVHQNYHRLAGASARYGSLFVAIQHDREGILVDPVEIDDAIKSNRGVALIIALLALLLAFSELGGSNADNEAIERNVEASNLWSFYQAKTIRRTTVQTAVEQTTLQLLAVTDPALRQAMEKQIAEWKAAADRYETEPTTGEGRQELAQRAKRTEAERLIQKAKGDIFDISSALLQIGIVLASATIITGVIALAWIAGILGAIGATLIGIGVWAPMLLSAYL